MAKKKETKVEVETSQIEEQVVVEQPKPKVEKTQPKVEKPQPKKKPSVEDNWEIKDRTYFLKGKRKPLTYIMKSTGIYWFDEEKGYERELKYAANQRTCFVDEMKGDQRLEHIVFQNGILIVPRNKTILQKLLSLYHPHKDKLYREFVPEKKAANEMDILDLQTDAMVVAREIEIDLVEAIMRVEIGSAVSSLSSKELRRDVMLYARRNPALFLELVNDDNVQLRNFGIKATELGIIKLSSDQRTFLWASNDRKLMNVPFDEHPYSALAAWFKTDEGMEVYQNIEKRLK